MDVFISWSGAKSKKIADGLRGWLPTVVRSIFWMMVVLTILVGAFLALVTIHLSNGLPMGRSVRGVSMDARVAINCPTNIELIWEFVNRSQLEDLSLQFAVGRSFRGLC